MTTEPLSSSDSADALNLIVIDGQQPHETALYTYLGLGVDRTIKEVAELTGSSPQKLAQWRKANAWDDKARAYDEKMARELSDRSLKKRIQLLEKSEQQQLTAAQIARAKFIEYVKDRAIEGEPGPNGKGWLRKGMDPQKALVALRFAEYADKTERLILGQPTENIQQSGGGVTIEQMQVLMVKALSQHKEWTQSNDIPALDVPNPLGEYEA